MSEDHNHKTYEFFVDAVKYHTDQESMSGEDIKKVANIPPNYNLYLEEDGNTADREISDVEGVTMSGRIKHFYAVPPATFGLRTINDELKAIKNIHNPNATIEQLPNGSHLVALPNVKLCQGWNMEEVRVLFVAPPGYPTAQPDCFWVEPMGLRLQGGGTPQASNDSNVIPGDNKSDRKATWFSWHLQSWDPQRDTLATYVNVIMQRLSPAR